MKRILLLLLLILFSIAGFAQSRYISAQTKKIVFARDGGKCQCCGTTSDLEYDHIKPFSCGGGSEPSNIQLLCGSCNRSKSNGNTCNIHHRVVGHGGCKGSSKNSSTKTAIATQCTGITQKGTRCKNKTKDPSGRCHHHR
jgi:hypothetical protein